MNTTTTMDRTQLREAVGTTDLLTFALARIDAEGWDRETGRMVLDYAMEYVVRPAVRAVGFTGTDAEYAEATGWSAAWEALSSRTLRSAASPWGVVTAAVRCAVLNERMAETYGTDARSAWRVHRYTKARGTATRRVAGDWSSVADPAALARPLSLTAMLDAGFDRPTAEVPADGPEWRLQAITEVLVRHGWKPDLAAAAVLMLRSTRVRTRPGHRRRAGGARWRWSWASRRGRRGVSPSCSSVRRVGPGWWSGSPPVGSRPWQAPS